MRSSNNYGPFEFPEQILQLLVTNALDEKVSPLMATEDIWKPISFETFSRSFRGWLL